MSYLENNTLVTTAPTKYILISENYKIIDYYLINSYPSTMKTV